MRLPVKLTTVVSSMEKEKNVVASRAAAKSKEFEAVKSLLEAKPAVEHFRKKFELDLKEVAHSYHELRRRPQGTSHLDDHQRLLMALGHACAKNALTGHSNKFNIPPGLKYMEKLLPTSMLKEWRDVLEQNKFTALTLFEKMRFFINENRGKSFKMGIEEYYYMALGSEYLGRRRKIVGQKVPLFPLDSLHSLDPLAIEEWQVPLERERGQLDDELKVKAIEMAKGETLTLS
ncbi:hypothetical protein PsorP6_013176 [Peronosclerospora sorghi]|uniref:Uncharacterized protein n=1 Tax=Peronosclerospora sorghi TaxID=230839 RepID=A0ACC0WFF5_9STRA|nr:hypothetical protein PsorP6_013176 [Peronosclerospora sorghi]